MRHGGGQVAQSVRDREHLGEPRSEEVSHSCRFYHLYVCGLTCSLSVLITILPPSHSPTLTNSAHAHTHIHSHKHTHTHTYTYTHSHTHTHTRTHTHTHTRTHTHSHTLTHTRTGGSYPFGAPWGLSPLPRPHLGLETISSGPRRIPRTRVRGPPRDRHPGTARAATAASERATSSDRRESEV